jgi:hypothetical protein
MARSDTDETLVRAIRLLRHDGWTVFKIAEYLSVELSVVRRALDPRAQAAHERWSR